MRPDFPIRVHSVDQEYWQTQRQGVRGVLPRPGDLAATIGAEYEVQWRQLCFGPYPSCAEVQARFQELKSIL